MNSIPARRASPRRRRSPLAAIHSRLVRHFGPAHWWPAETPFEVCVGAMLVQNTAWSNVVKALESLRQAGRLDFEGLDALTADEIAPLVRASGCFRVKARRLRAFLDFLRARYGGRVEAMRDETPDQLRAALLRVPGIGRETADSIVLYAAGLPMFVIDAYTRRVFARLGLVEGDEPYDELQRFFVERLPRESAAYNEFHAQVVNLAKEVCRPRPRCAACPIEDLCEKRAVSSPA